MIMLVQVPSELIESGLHWQYLLENGIRTLSLSWVSPINGKAFKKHLMEKGNRETVKSPIKTKLYFTICIQSDCGS